jgi:L-cysteine:1D-myo-inositol 2-amino-2-deoxy-alpha-D-glucopyranoside ligase
VRSWPAPEVPRIEGSSADEPVRVRDSSTGRLVELGASRDELSMYVCGITPYDATHLGHAATYLLFDEVQRVARDAGKRVRYVQNVTDVDDPLLERAVQTGEDWTAIAERETQLFREDMAALRVIPPQAYIGAVEAIPDIVDAVEVLRDRGAAYDVEGDTYFSVSSAPDFGEVSHLSVPDMVRLSGERGGDPDRPGKKDPLDSLLWQSARPGEPAWDSSLGHGRPGWHVECAAIALKHLGATIDVQGGGDDLVFPHHEMSAAQAAVITGEHPFARAFVHQAMVGYDGEKMSKSRGNLVLVSKLRSDGVDPMAIRLALLAHRHDAAWEWHDAEINAAVARLDRWRAAFARPAGPPAAPLIDALRHALRNGLDTPAALDAVDTWAGTDGADGADAAAPKTAATAVDALLGIV